MPRKKRLNQRKRALIAAAAYAAHRTGSSSRHKTKATSFSGWNMKAKIGFWGLVEESASK